MKFAREIERESVPEWKTKYFCYKAGKDHVKAIKRAINRTNGRADLLTSAAAPRGLVESPRPNSPIRSNEELPAQCIEGQDGRGVIQTTGREPDLDGVNERARLTSCSDNGMFYGGFASTPAAGARADFIPPKRAVTLPGKYFPTFDSSPPRPRRLFSAVSFQSRLSPAADVMLKNLDDVRRRQSEFFKFMDSELMKISNFFATKEGHASKRLDLLREQLHEMRKRRNAEITQANKGRERVRQDVRDGVEGETAKSQRLELLSPFKRLAISGPNWKALHAMVPKSATHAGTTDERRDYACRPADDPVPYRTAKRKLKMAMQEFYRGLELLKSYALQNRTAFRKINKKYDKVVKGKSYRYYNEKVNKSYFVTSDALDNYLQTVELLYAESFERGNRKIAAGKLRQLSRPSRDASSSSFTTGLYLGVGSVLGLQGLFHGLELARHPDTAIRQQASYLLQLYGGYFLILYMAALFTLSCRFWGKVNYALIFEFDRRDRLNWIQMAQFSSAFFCLFGGVLFLNFHPGWTAAALGETPTMFLYWPVVLLAITALVLFFPAPIFYFKTRRWLLYSHCRLLFSGIYPVEFRDFFLGDIWCSLSYALSNIPLFFCLYSHHWGFAAQCNSSQSRLAIGLLATMPPTIRALQCIRRYIDSGHKVFPHLVNCGKYTMTILSAVCLSLYRVRGSTSRLALFVSVSAVNSIYCIIWDLFMDVSLLQPHSRNFLLRDILALSSRWPYYLLISVDPLMRCLWVSYAIFAYDRQHSTFATFLLAFAEATRRGLWAFFRVENEHCSNVAQEKASRDDIPLPYRLLEQRDFVDRSSLEDPVRDEGDQEQPSVRATTSVNSRVAEGIGNSTPGPRPTPGTTGEDNSAEERRPQVARQQTILRHMAEAHKQDFEKKRKSPEAFKTQAPGDDQHEGHTDDDDDDDDDEDEVAFEEERNEARHAEPLFER